MQLAGSPSGRPTGKSSTGTSQTGPGDGPALSAAMRALGVGAPPPQLALSLVLTVECGFVLVGFLNILDADPGALVLAASALGFGLIFVIQLVHSAYRLRRVRERWGRWTLTLQALLTYLPLFGLGFGWGGMAGFLGASVLLVLRPATAWPLFGLVVAAACATGPLLGLDPVNSVYIAVSTVLTALIVYGLSQLAQLVLEVQEAQQDFARLAVTQERLRFARDLHDLLGYSLSAITLKSELALRLVGGHPDRAQDELTGILEISRQALSDVRTVARGYREMSLAAEAVSAQSVLEAAGIQVTTELSGEPPQGEVDTIMATVLREAITNLLRHSKAEHCRIESRTTDAGDIVLLITNDGAQRGTVSRWDLSAAPDGSGLENLQFRLTSVGGRLTSGVDESGHFVLRAEAPLRRRPGARSA
ncbi:sensor histidine kinase [Streptomyces mayonensis]|uniref:sensor histidine kinase n=1 Tax=Streptomyces mayonensis TaxID=2750816 RepID=UPI001C1E43C5|nr:histidine kinase [Streptomyces sp. A108]MBU6533328.1 two-component sensor histidine kinase [Streptomyces sp. A108]